MKLTFIKKFLLAPALAAILSVSAHALTIGGAGYVGSIVDGIPPSVANETLWVNSLINLAPGGVAVVGSETLTRSANPTTWPLIAIYGVKLEEGNLDPTPDVTGFSFVLGKYGNGNDLGQISHVWYVGGTIGDVTLPTQALSHVTLFTSPSTGVPDSGSTIALLGAGLMLLGLARRKFVR